MENIKVIDISYAQQEVEFDKLKDDGVGAVIIRTGYLGKTDIMFRSHMENAIKAGMDIGVYTYMVSENTEQAEKEAYETVKRIEEYRGYINYPVFCDMEHSKYYDTVRYNKKKRTDMIETFCKTVDGRRYYPGVYINPAWLEQWTDKKRILGKYDIWLAAWTDSPDKPTKYDYGQRMWQWGTGRADGINGAVDCNLCYVDYPTVIRKAARNFLSGKCMITAKKEVDYMTRPRIMNELREAGFTVSSDCD